MFEFEYETPFVAEMPVMRVNTSFIFLPFFHLRRVFVPQFF